MDTKAHYTLVGLAVVTLLAALTITILWLSVGLDRPTYDTFMVHMDQSVVGLNTDASVKFNGVDVGYVKSMSLNPENAQEVIVELQIKTGTPVTTSTVATLAPQGITGLAYISLSATTPDAPLMPVRDTPPFPVIPSQPSLLVQLNSLLKDASAGVQSMSTSVQNVLDAQNAANFKAILIHLNTISQNIANNTNNINEMLKQTDIILKNTAQSSQQFPQMMTNLNDGIQNLRQVSNFIKEGMLPMMRLLNHLDTISGNVESFSNDIKQNPAILIRGKAVNNLGPGEQ